MGFNAATAVSRLDWDFTEYVPDAKGVTPEPSSDQAEAFLAAIRELTGVEEEREATERIAQMSTEEMRAIEQKLIGAVADVCSNCPTREQVEGLPYRQRQAFFGYMFGQMLNPQ